MLEFQNDRYKGLEFHQVRLSSETLDLVIATVNLLESHDISGTELCDLVFGPCELENQDTLRG